MNTGDAIYTRLTGDAEFVALCGTFATQPSVFVGDVIGSNVKAAQHGPFVIVRDAAVTDEDTGLDLRRQVMRVFIYGEPAQEVGALSVKVRDLLHRTRFSTSDGQVIGSKASGPVDAPTSDPSIIGRVVTVAFLKQE